MSNVIKFKSNEKPIPVVEGSTIDNQEPARQNSSTLLTVLSWTWVVVRYPIFLVLYWLRMPIVFLCNLISIPALFAWLFAWYAFPEKPEMVWGIAVISLTCFVIAWSYDFILMLLSPQQMMKTL